LSIRSNIKKEQIMTECAVIVSGNIHNQTKVDTYKNVAGPVMKKYGAVMPPKTYQVSEIIAGQVTPSFMLKIEFSDKEKAIAAFDDPEYQAVINIRDEGFGDLSIFMIG
jgi:uncharacterized protein (DUF1330 family)